MTDYFALLGEPRRPWIEAAGLKASILARSVEVHPDRFHDAHEVERRSAEARFAGLNSALRCLCETKTRLQHLLTLERGNKHTGVHSVPADLSDVFTDVGEALRSSDQALREKAAATSPLLKVQAMQRALDCAEVLRGLQGRLELLRKTEEEGLARLNPRWESAPSPGEPARESALPLAELERACCALSFLGRWSAQVQERVVQLTM